MTRIKSDIEIARKAKMKPINKILAKIKSTTNRNKIRINERVRTT